MNSSHTKINCKDDSLYSKVPSASVNSLRKLFEHNFKLSNITTAFRSKSHKRNDVQKNFAKSADHVNSSEFKENQRFLSTSDKIDSKLTDIYANNSYVADSDPEKGNYLNCKIENCCCKTFFREYNDTPNFRYRQLPKTPLKERSSELNRLSSIGVKCSTENEISNISYDSDLGRNKYYKINYNFYKPREIANETLVLRTSEGKLKKTTGKESKNLLKNVDGSEKNICNSFVKNRPDSHDNKKCAFSKFYEKSDFDGFVNFTAASLNEGGYIKNKNEKKKVPNEYNCKNDHKVNAEENKSKHNREVIEENIETNLMEIYKVGNFTFKYKIPKSKNIAIREHSYPYSLKKPRLTVKGVKNRNMRNVKRRQKVDSKLLSRSHTFNGYDNFAYRRSITELHLSKYKEDDDDDDDDDKYKSEEKIIPISGTENINSEKIVNEDGQFHADNRMVCYSLPVTSFYIHKNESQFIAQHNRCSSYEMKYASSSDLNDKHNSNKLFNFKNKACNLKRHYSLGYLGDEYYEYNLMRCRHSLDNLSKVSATCGIRNIPEVNKIIKPRKFQNLDIHVHALFAAVEHGYVDKTKTILESSEVDVNSVNSDGLSPLDVAVLSNNKPLVKILIAHGAQEGQKFHSVDSMRNHLYGLLHEAERRVQELESSLRLNVESDQSSISSSSSNIPSITIGDSSQNKTYSIWERRAKGLKRMLMGFEQIRPPDLPATVTVEITSTSSIMVYFSESENKDSSITTKFRVQWSMDKDFHSLCGHYEVADMRQLKYHINNLRKGQKYYIRVASGNLKGYSVYKLSIPSFIVPSSWQDVTQKNVRFSSSMRQTLDDIFSNVVVTHPYLKNNVELHCQSGEMLINQRKKKPTIKQLFTVASKFQKHLRRGVYLSCLLYHDDKILVTNEEFLPVVEVDENYQNNIHADFHWFFKVAFSWSDLRWLKSDMEKSQNSSIIFRIKLLQATAHMQSALGIQELGKLYHKLLRDGEGTLVISVINYVHSTKAVSFMNSKWLPLTKLTKRTNLVNLNESNVADILMSSISDQITYHQVSSIKLPKGLYLSYLKMRSSVDSLQVLVPSRAPNIPPHCKVRDNPHVTAEEWEWLVKKENLRDGLSNATQQQRLFIEQIVVTARRLFTYMEVSDEEAVNHRLYDAEIIEVNKDVSLIVIVPPAEAACSMPGQRELLLQRSDLLPLTVQVFEMVHFGTYQLDLISTYSKLSCIIEMDVDLAQHCCRKAFSSIEVSTAKSKLAELENLHLQLNTAWKRSRWLLDVISFARERLSLSPTNMRHLLHVHPKRTLPAAESHCYLQPPDPKTAKSRGSWPGVGVGRQLGRMPNEISRSEQLLTSECVPITQSSTKIVVKQISSSEKQSESESKNLNVATVRITDTSILASNTGITKHTKVQNITVRPTSGNSSSGCIHSVSSDDLSVLKSTNNDEERESVVRVPVPSPAVIKIHAAYDTGLDIQIHFKFQVSSKTTAREIVELFVKQTNMSTLLKGKEGPIYSDKEIANFCLVAVVGARERCLRDDFRPVQLQQPWKDGRLYVRRKSNVLAAIEHDSKQSSLFV